jgi:pimeloyl-ACP methyl ester carboxylesterase
MIGIDLFNLLRIMPVMSLFRAFDFLHKIRQFAQTCAIPAPADPPCNRRPPDAATEERGHFFNKAEGMPERAVGGLETIMRTIKEVALIASISATFAFSQASIVQAQTVEAGLVKLSDSTIEYVSRGEGDPIILLPAANLTVGYLDGLARELAKGGYRVVGINFRGSGKSVGPIKGVTLETLADDVAGVMQALQLGPAHLVGNDFGNRVARLFAASHPDLARSVTLLSVSGRVEPKPDALKALDTIFNAKSTDAEAVAAMPYLIANSADAARVWALLKPSRDLGASEIERAASAATNPDDWWAPTGDAKYLILQGEDDLIAPPKNGAQLLKDAGDRATLVNLSRAGHLFPLEQPQATASRMIEFFKQLGG